MDEVQFRNLVKEAAGRLISSDQAEHFLELFKGDLDDTINKALRGFIEKHFGRKNDLNKAA